MIHRMASWRGSFHEAPLVGFTAATIAGAGLVAATTLAWELGFRVVPPGRRTADAAVVLLCGGLLISILHLGRPSRMALAIRRAGRNALGTEVLLALLSAVAAFLLSCLPESAIALRPLWIFSAVAAIGLLASLGWVYWLPGQLTWRGAPALSAIPLGLLFGFTAETATGLRPSNSTLWVVSILAVIDAASWIMRCALAEKKRRAGTAVHPGVMALRRWFYPLRFVLVSLPPVATLVFGAGISALVPLGAGILLDRFSFYGMAIRQTTEHEIARVESILEILGERKGED